MYAFFKSFGFVSKPNDAPFSDFISSNDSISYNLQSSITLSFFLGYERRAMSYTILVPVHVTVRSIITQFVFSFFAVMGLTLFYLFHKDHVILKSLDRITLKGWAVPSSLKLTEKRCKPEVVTFLFTFW